MTIKKLAFVTQLKFSPRPMFVLKNKLTLSFLVKLIVSVEAVASLISVMRIKLPATHNFNVSATIESIEKR